MQGQWYGLEIFFCFWIHTSGFHSHKIHVIISKSRWSFFSPLTSHRLLRHFLWSSHHTSTIFFFLWPSTQAEVIIVHITGVLQDNKVFLPGVTQLLSGWGPARSWWAGVGPSKESGRAHDSNSSGSPPLLVTHGNQCTNTHKFTGRLKCSGLCMSLIAGVWQWGWGEGSAVDLYIIYSTCVWVKVSETRWGTGAVL